MINSELVKKLLDYNDGLLFWRFRDDYSPAWNAKHAGKRAGCLRPDGYWTIRLNGKLYLRSRLVWLYFNTEMPPEIDHINRNSLDDRIENLRVADRYINNQNTKARGTTKLGEGRYWARIFRYGRARSLGVYKTEEEAHEAYLNAK